MNEFILIFRRDYKTKAIQLSTTQAQEHLEQWRSWIELLVSKDKLSRPMQQLDREGRILKESAQVCNGPYIEVKESMGGILFIKAEDYAQAIEIANGCPILRIGGNVEIRKEV